MPFHGVAAPGLRAVLRPHLAAYAPPDRAAWEHDVRELWDGATHREERYAAIALARHRLARPWQDVASLDLDRHLVVTGAWWDLVDPVASHLVGEEMRRMIDEPEHRAEIDASLRDVYAAMGVTTNPIPVKAALELAGHPVGGLRLPLVEADEDERAQIRAVLERHGLLASAGAP